MKRWWMTRCTKHTSDVLVLILRTGQSIRRMCPFFGRMTERPWNSTGFWIPSHVRHPSRRQSASPRPEISYNAAFIAYSPLLRATVTRLSSSAHGVVVPLPTIHIGQLLIFGRRWRTISGVRSRISCLPSPIGHQRGDSSDRSATFSVRSDRSASLHSVHRR
jgi:hypothetical protein